MPVPRQVGHLRLEPLGTDEAVPVRGTPRDAADRVVDDHRVAPLLDPAAVGRTLGLHGLTLFDARRPSVPGRSRTPSSSRRRTASDDADATIEVLLAQSRLPVRIVIADASEPTYQPPTELAERARLLGVDLVVLPSRPSVHVQRNLGVRQVETPIVLFLDDDVRIPPNYADALLVRWEKQGLEAFGGIQGTPADVPRQSSVARTLRRLAMLSYVDPTGEAMTLRRSGKVRFVPEPSGDVRVPVLASGATAYRTELALAHPFDERFAGYTPGGDLEMASRVAVARAARSDIRGALDPSVAPARARLVHPLVRARKMRDVLPSPASRPFPADARRVLPVVGRRHRARTRRLDTPRRPFPSVGLRTGRHADPPRPATAARRLASPRCPIGEGWPTI